MYPQVLHNPELAFFSDYLLSMGASLPPKPEPKQQKEPSPAAPPPTKEEEMEVESEPESDVELDMEGVIKSPDPEEAHEMV